MSTINTPNPSQGRYKAGPWSRLLARFFDLWLATFIVGFVFGLFAGAVWGGFPTVMNNAIGWSLFTIMILPPAMAVDALIRRWFGNTPGKALLGIQVLDGRGNHLDDSRYMGRNFNLWWRGLGLGIAFITLVTMLVQFRRLQAGRKTSYDEIGPYQVIRQPQGNARTLVFSLLFLGVLGMTLAQHLLFQEDDSYFDGIIHGPFTWTHNTTGLSVEFDENWHWMVRNNEHGSAYELFASPVGDISLIIASELIEGYSLESYGHVFVTNGKYIQMDISDHDMIDLGNRPVWHGEGTFLDIPGSHLNVHIGVDPANDSKFWRIISIHGSPDQESEAMLNEMTERLLAAW